MGVFDDDYVSIKSCKVQALQVNSLRPEQLPISWQK